VCDSWLPGGFLRVVRCFWHAAATGVVLAVPEVLMRVVLPVRGIAGLV
jgi:hypothetical protein